MLVDGFVVRSILEAADGDSLDRLPEDRFEQLAKHVGLLMVKNPVHRKPRENAPTFSFNFDKADSDRGGGELSDDEEDQENKAPLLPIMLPPTSLRPLILCVMSI